jgi:tetratricopeptide (TPR) repeat protein
MNPLYKRRAARRSAAMAAILLLLDALPAPAQTRPPQAPPFGASDQQRYASCMNMARNDARLALREAQAWRKVGGGDPAMHCIAVALLGMGEYQQAALNLESLARSKTLSTELRGELFGQAGDAWILAHKPANALKDQTEALKLKPKDVDLLLDRAITLSGLAKYWEALDDLNRALTVHPGHVEVLVWRAATWRHLKSYDLAEDDATRALALQPNRLDALLERGTIRKARGNLKGARADWLRILDLTAKGPVREAAQRELELMDVKTTK